MKKLMKKKTYLCIALVCVFSITIPGQTTKVIPPVQLKNVMVTAPLKIGIMAQSALDGHFSHTVNLSRSGQPVSGAKIYCGSVLLTESKPGYYEGGSVIPVNLGQGVSFSIVDRLGVSCSATAKIKNFARIAKPGNGEAINRNQGGVVVQWTLAAGSAQVYFLVYASGAPSYNFNKDNITSGQFIFPLGGVPAAATGLTFHVFFPSLGGMSANDFTFSGNVTSDSFGNLSLYDKVFVNLK